MGAAAVVRRVGGRVGTGRERDDERSRAVFGERGQDKQEAARGGGEGVAAIRLVQARSNGQRL